MNEERNYTEETYGTSLEHARETLKHLKDALSLKTDKENDTVPSHLNAIEAAGSENTFSNVIHDKMHIVENKLHQLEKKLNIHLQKAEQRDGFQQILHQKMNDLERHFGFDMNHHKVSRLSPWERMKKELHEDVNGLIEKLERIALGEEPHGTEDLKGHIDYLTDKLEHNREECRNQHQQKLADLDQFEQHLENVKRHF